MTPENMPKRKLPKIKITKDEIEGLKIAAAITDILAENPDLTENIVKVFMEASTVPREERLVAGYEVKEKVTEMIAEKLKDIPHDEIVKYYPQWSRVIWNIHQHTIPHTIPRVHGDPGPEF